MLVVLGQALDAAARERLATANVASLVNRPASAPVVVKKTWTADQVRTFLVYVADDRLAAAWRLTMLGLRRGEVLGLRWSDVDFEAKSARIQRARVPEGGRIVVNKPKTSTGVRTVYLPAEVVSDLLRLRAMQDEEHRSIGAGDPDDGWILVDLIGRPYRPEWYGKEFRRLSAEAGLPRIRLTTPATPPLLCSRRAASRSASPRPCSVTTPWFTCRPTSVRTKTRSEPPRSSSQPSIADT